MPTVLLISTTPLLAGCSGTTSGAADPAPRPVPHWECRLMSEASRDFVAGAKGYATRADALADDAMPGATWERVPPEPVRQHRGHWLAVTADGVIVKPVDVTDGRHGWLVDSIQKCGSDRSQLNLGADRGTVGS